MNYLHIFRNDYLCRYAYQIGVKKNEPLVYSVEDSLKDLRNMSVKKRPILLFGHMFINDRLDYIRMLSDTMGDRQFIIVDERCIYDGHTVSNEKITQLSENLWIAYVPDILWKDAYRRFVNADVQCDLRKTYCRMAAENLKKRHYDMGRGYPELIVQESYRYFTGVISILKPCMVIMWNQFHAIHIVLKGVCDDYCVPTAYMEFGLLPHTYVIDKEGQMGRSHIATSKIIPDCPKKSDLTFAQSIIDKWVADMKVVPKQNPNNKRYKILYIGQNDYESGIVPYTEDSARFHSPVFHNSLDCLRFLSSVCKSNNWDLTYRPHPIYANFEMMRESYKLAHVDFKSRIEDQMSQADVVITILSKSAYMALALNKPVVMLGYTQLCGKECTYEAFDSDSIESTIQCAIENGQTAHMRDAYIAHIANIASTYLYDDYSGNGIGLNIQILSQALSKDCSQIESSKTEPST